MSDRPGGRHLFRGGHHPGTVKGSLQVEHRRKREKDRLTFTFTLTNIGAAHYLPTGTPDKHLTLELRLLDENGKVVKEKTHTMKRSIMWRPVIVDLKDTRLAYRKPRIYTFSFTPDSGNPPAMLDVTVRYHLLDEERRTRIGYENKNPIAYAIYHERLSI
jgi:hypothetical protein